MVRHALLVDYFTKYQPDVVFTPYIFGVHDVVFGKVAQRRGIVHVGGILSWDNATTKTLMRIKPDKLIVQNDVIKAETVKYHSIDPKTICVTGVAHYDYYRAYQPIPRNAFFQKMGIGPKKKLILISPAGSKFIDTDWHIFEMLKNAYTNGELPHDVHFLIRPHPANLADFGDFEPNEHFTVDVPGVRFEGMRAKDNELGKDDIHHLIDTLTYTDVLINTVSTVAIDSAVFDVPVITIAFDGYHKDAPFSRSTRRYLSDVYMAKLLSVGGSEEVHNEQELVEAVNKYLEDRSYRQAERKNVITQQCYRLDGKAKERIAACVLGT
jgi:CDP-glycerol glycerophosphotransferase (TagB/SpsB family)